MALYGEPLGNFFTSTNSTLRNTDGSWALSEQTQADIFVKHLSNIFQPHHNIIPPSKIEEVKSYLDSPLPIYPLLRHFTPVK